MEEDQLKARIEQIFRDLDAYSYYELFSLTPTVSVDEIRAAFHRMALLIHPDRYQHHADSEFKQQIYTIYKRMTEGYGVLKNDESRRKYDEGLAQGELRLVQTERKKTGPKRLEEELKNPNAKKFFKLAQDAERRGDLKNARINYKFALDMEGESAFLQEKLAELNASK